MSDSLQLFAPEMRRHFAQLAAELHPELLKRAIRNGLARVGGSIRRRGTDVFAEKVPQLGRRADKAVRLKIHRDLSGFRVRIVATRQHGMVVNRYGKARPLPKWFEHGARGVIGPAASMEALGEQYSIERVQQMLAPDIEKAAENIIKRLGL